MSNTTQLISIIQPGQALMSLRDSGYNFPTAIAEVIDNSIEANANNIAITLFENMNNDGKKHIDRIIFSDDGDGMNIDVLHHYLVIGHSTRWMRKDTIGKYGVGAKLAALNFALRIEAWSRTSVNKPWIYVKFDLEEALKQEQKNLNDTVGIQYPIEKKIPEEYLKSLQGETGTLIVWSKVDRLENCRSAANTEELKAELTKELGRIFREFINNGIKLKLNDKTIIHHDPLMLMDESWADTILNKELKNKDPKNGLKHFSAMIIADQVPIQCKDGRTATITVTLYPKEITRQRGQGGDTLAKKLRVPENQGCISFMRLKREIAYTNVPRIFSRAIDDPDRFIGIEVNFTPIFDDYFGVRNVKRGVEPFNDLRMNIRKILSVHIKTARHLLDESWAQAAQQIKAHSGEHGRMEEELSIIEKTMPKSRVKKSQDPAKERKAQKEELEALARDTGKNSSNEEIDTYREEKKKLPYVIENVDFPGKSFIDIKHINNQVIIRINTRHRFYKEMWKPLHDMAENDKTARRAVEGLTLMVAAYAKAQSMNEDPYQYEDLTESWGIFLNTMMNKVKDTV